jgi:hypothetical protein
MMPPCLVLPVQVLKQVAAMVTDKRGVSVRQGMSLDLFITGLLCTIAGGWHALGADP